MRNTLSVFLWLSSLLSSFAEPFLFPNNSFFRHEVQLLGDRAEFTFPKNTWPLDLGRLHEEYSENFDGLPHNLLEDRIAKESNSGWSPFSATLSIRDDRVTVRGFSSKAHANFTSNVSASWMNDRFAAKLSVNSLYGMEQDWKGREDEGFALDGSYLATRLGNWSASLGQIDRWWGPGWDGSLILSSNARPIPAISFDRRTSEPFENKWLSWLGPWSVHSFVGRLEKERTVSNPYLWGMRGEIAPTFIEGLEVGFFRMIQLGGQGRPEGFSTWVDAFLSQDNYGANTGRNNRSQEPGNQLAGIDMRWKVLDAPIAVYAQVVGEDEDKFLPNCLMFQYGVEAWREMESSSLRLFVEYVDLTSHWWTDRDYSDNSPYNINYGHHIYHDGYRYRGRPIGHWADQDSRIISFGGMHLHNSGVGWGFTARQGDLNEDGAGSSSVSNGFATRYSSIEVTNSRHYSNYDLSVETLIGWESLDPEGSAKDDGLCASLSITRTF